MTNRIEWDRISSDAHKCILNAIRTKGFAVVLSAGGRSIGKFWDFFSLHAHSKSLSNAIDWSRVHLFLTDERISQSSDDKNATLIQSKCRLPLKMHFYRNDPNLYFQELELTRATEKIDLALLSAGEDGHIASLFPRSPLLTHDDLGYFYVKNSPKPPRERVTISQAVLRSQLCNAFLFFEGTDKLEAYRRFLDPTVNPCDCPAKILLNSGCQLRISTNINL